MVHGWIADAFALACVAASAAAASLNASISRPRADQSFYLLGGFDAVSNYDTVEKYNLSNPTVGGLYEVAGTAFNGTSGVHIVGFSPFNGSTPSQMYNVDNKTILAVVSGTPVLYDTETNRSSSLGGWESVSGDVLTAYVDQKSSLLYLGGELKYNKSHGALVYNVQKGQLAELPFSGFGEGSVVRSIVKYGDLSIIFGGSFDSLGNETLQQVSGTNSTLTNSTSSTSNSSSSSSSSELVQPEQPINLGLASVSASNGASGSNPSSLVCPAGSSSAWRMSDAQVGGSWSAQLPFSVTPSKIRLYNGNQGGNAVKMFRITSAPANSIMNLTYIDPETQQLVYCDAWCPLSLDSTLESAISNSSNATDGVFQISGTDDLRGTLGFGRDYQEFAFVNSVQLNSLTVQVLDQYGDYAVLNGLQLLQYGLTVYANNTLNGSGCSSNSTEHESVSSASSELLGSANWSGPLDGGDYLSTTVSSGSISTQDGVQYNMDLSLSGNYTFLLYTPGCGSDGTCSQRGAVNASLFAENGTLLASKTVSQTNTDLKYDVVFSGDIDRISTQSSAVYLRLTCLQASGAENTTFVAGSVAVQFNSIDYTPETATSVPLNGLFEYSLANFTDRVSNPVGNSSINLLGSAHLSENARVTSLQLANSTALYVAGGFNSSLGDNLFGVTVKEYNKSSSQIVLGDTIRVPANISSPVSQMRLVGTDLVLADGTVSVFGVNGSNMTTVSSSSTQTVNAVSPFRMNGTDYVIVGYNSTGASSAASFVFSVPGGDTINSTDILGLNLTTASLNSNESSSSSSSSSSSYSTVYGQITCFDQPADGIVFLQNGTRGLLQSLDSLLSPGTGSATNTGLYLNSSAVLLAGNYSDDGRNIIVLGTESSEALSDDLFVPRNATVTTLVDVESNIFIGLQGPGASFKGKAANGLVVYDYVQQNATIPSLEAGGLVNAVSRIPASDSALIGGNFTSSSSKFNNLAYYNLTTNSLDSALSGLTLTGVVNSLEFYSKEQALVAGDLGIGTSGKSYFGVYNWTAKSLTAHSNLANTVPGAVLKFAFLNGNKTTSLDEPIVAMGSDYLGYLDNYKYESLMSGIGNESTTPVFKDFAILNRSSGSSSNSVFAEKLLVLAGRFELQEYGLVSSAIYDGSKWYPLTITASNLNVTDSIMNFILPTTKSYSLNFNTTQPPTSSPQPSNVKNGIRYFTNGQIAGIGCALAVGTTMLLTTIGGLFYLFGNRDTVVGPLKSRVGEERMMSVVPPSQVIDNMNKARAGTL